MLEKILFILFAAPAVTSGVAILLSTNIVRMAFWLIAMLVSVAGLYFLMGAYFIGAVQILVYVGGVAVLMVFGIMLTSRRLGSQLRPKGWEALWLAIVGSLLMAGLVLAILQPGWKQQEVLAANSAADIGRSLLGDFLGPFELVSLLLLAAMLGAAYLADPKARPEEKQKEAGA
jgi:NADH:ubiquinone oxidoreductase subunit 6 (subunit J)